MNVSHDVTVYGDGTLLLMDSLNLLYRSESLSFQSIDDLNENQPNSARMKGDYTPTFFAVIPQVVYCRTHTSRSTCCASSVFVAGR